MDPEEAPNNPSEQIAQIAEKLEQIAARMEEAARKDSIISELHSDLTRRHTDVLADLRRPLIQGFLKIYCRLADISRSAHASDMDSRLDAFDTLRNQVDIAADLCRDILTDDLDLAIVEPADGDPYDKRLHLSIDTTPTPIAELAGHVARCLEPGFANLASGNVVRQAKVVTYAQLPANPQS